MDGDLSWWMQYSPKCNTLTVSLLGPPNLNSPLRPARVVAEAAVTVDAPKDLLDKEIERVKAELLERHRTVTALVEKHNGEPVSSSGPS